MRLVLLNPNTDRRTTEAMLSVARNAAPEIEIEGETAPFGARLITDTGALGVAARAVATWISAADLHAVDGVILAAFGDPGLGRARERCSCPVTGIAEAGMAKAAEGFRPFAIVTTTPALVVSIRQLAGEYGHSQQLTGVFATSGDPASLTAEPERLVQALFEACAEAVDAGANAIVIGGGPLAAAARALQGNTPVPLIEPVPEAVRLARQRARAYGIGAAQG